jgi:ABC-type sugar transport system ATPase subunit
MNSATPLLQLKGIKKSFGHVRVLTDIDFEINYGEIVALIGDNGAGKSTLIKIITGVHKPTAGEIYFKGQPMTARNMRATRALGIEAVYQ